MLLMAVGNNHLAGGGFDVAPKAKLDDGLLDLAVVRHQPNLQITRLAAELKNIDDPGNQILFYRQLGKFTLEFQRDVHFNLDGEPISKSRLKFSVLPRHLKLAF
jgi:diacylglycerol kinase family enzyme